MKRWDSEPTPIYKDKTIDEVFEQDLAECRPPMAPFDGYCEKVLKVSSSCLISYDRNRYSVPAQYAGKPISLRVYADRLKIIADHQVIAEHQRRFTRDQSFFEPWHYVPILQRKPGALRNGAPFKDWDLPPALQRIKARYLKRPGGDREFVELLLMIQRYDLDSVNTACLLALEQGTGHLPIVINILHRLTEQQRPKALNVINYPRIEELPKADCQRYDRLIQKVNHAESG